jgi:hypothetical protein
VPGEGEGFEIGDQVDEQEGFRPRGKGDDRHRIAVLRRNGCIRTLIFLQKRLRREQLLCPGCLMSTNNC